MPNNNRLLKKQKPTVETWMQQNKGKLVRVINRTCNYRDAIVEWSECIAQPNNTTLITTYQTILELTPVGKIRREESKKTDERLVEGSDESLLPLIGVFFSSVAPKTKVRQHLYPKDEDYIPKNRKNKPKQLTLPLDPTSERLQQVSLNHGDKTIYSVEELLSGTEEFYSLEFGYISLPSPFIALLKSYQCSIDEWEAIAQLSLVLNPQQLLPIIESIPTMRKMEQFSQFKEPVKVNAKSTNTNISSNKVSQPC